MTKQHGGKRDGAGRKSRFAVPMRKVTVTLPTHYIAALRALDAKGKLSSGIRSLVESSGILDSDRL